MPLYHSSMRQVHMLGLGLGINEVNIDVWMYDSPPLSLLWAVN